MSLYFNCVIHCEFHADLQEEFVEILRHITSFDSEREFEFKVVSDDDFIEIAPFMVRGGRYLRPDVKGLVLSSFDTLFDSEGKVSRHILQYSGHEIHDDFFYDYHIPLVMWIAERCTAGLIGYYYESMAQYAYPAKLFLARDGQLIVMKLNADGSTSDYDTA